MHSDTANNNNNNSSGDLPSSLEEFGLSKYEARAYLTMIGRGSLAASDLAYYANLPRTKVYQTVKKLEKKRLAVISKQKPLICSATPPEEAFGEIVNLHERRVKNMRKIVERLQKINDEGPRPRGSEERRYFILDPDSALAKVGSLIATSRSSVTATLDAWGLRLASQCRSQLVKAVTNGARVRFIVDSRCVGSENLFSLPEDIDLRMADDVSSNLLIIDSAHMFSIDSSNGKAALFASPDAYGTLQIRGFEELWGKATELKHVLDGQPVAMAARAIELARAVENGLSAHMLECAINNEDPSSSELLEVMEKKYGLSFAGIGAAEMLELVDSALKISCLGGARHDRGNNIVSLQSKAEGKHVLPWAVVLASYFRRSGNEPRIMMQRSKQSPQLVHVRLARPIA
ncbi:MAG: helix-turn-helix domain-containing protein [Nitrososphaera sp.]|jgi:sugar-specific transcriptional regulator TrmB